LKDLTINSFQNALNDTFVLRANPTQTLDLQLVAVNDLATRSEQLSRVPFSLHFRGPTTPWAQQHIYRLENEKLGALEMFLVPVGPDAKGMIYEAVFS
jgi:hypothetical protein